MPAFELEQVDGEGTSIDLPDGGTVVGRGPFLRVNDKRVSRNHGILENIDGRLRLKPTHVNPCFIQESLEATPQPLEKDTWHCLKDGSIFSLLPGKYIYRVHAIAEGGTLGNSQGYEEDMEAQMEIEQDPKSSRSCEETQAYTPQPRDSVSFTTKIKDGTQTLDPDTKNQVDAAVSTTNVPDPLTHQRKRVLPAWMLATSSAVHSPSTTKAAAAPKRAPKQTPRNPPPSKHAAPKRARRKHEVSLSGDEEEDDDKWEDEECSEVEPMPRKRARKLESDLEDSQDQAPAQKPSEDKTFKVEEVSVEERKEEEGKARASEGAEGTSRSRTGSSSSVTESSGNSQVKKQSSQDVQQLVEVAGSAQAISSNAKAKSQRRNPCPYGTSCYRKNPIHFQECSHPGDDDYEEEQNEDDEDDDRPECPYGTDCYRKNPLHKKEYKHTKPPAPIKKPTSRADDDDDDEDRYEDSFINDESEEEEVDEDSDYVPESEDSGAEDVKQLQKEAKTFLKKKK